MKGEEDGAITTKLFDEVRGANYPTLIKALAVIRAVKPTYKRVIMESGYPWVYFIVNAVEEAEGYKVILTFKTDSSD